MSTIGSMSVVSTDVKLGDNAPIKVYGFSGRHIASLLNMYPELTDIFREARISAAQAKAKNEGFTLVDLAALAIEGALESIDRSALAFAITYAVRDDVSTEEKLTAAIDAADNLPLEWQIKIVAEAFALTMPDASANFRTAIANLARSSESETASNTGSDE